MSIIYLAEPRDLNPQPTEAQIKKQPDLFHSDPKASGIGGIKYIWKWS